MTKQQPEAILRGDQPSAVVCFENKKHLQIADVPYRQRTY